MMQIIVGIIVLFVIIRCLAFGGPIPVIAAVSAIGCLLLSFITQIDIFVILAQGCAVVMVVALIFSVIKYILGKY